MSDSSNRNFSRGGRGRNRGRAPSSGTGSWRAAGAPSAATDAGSGAPAAPSAPAAPTPAPAPAPTAAAGGQQAASVINNNNKPRQRADSHRKQPSRTSSISAAPPPPITVTAPAASAAPSPAPATATASTPQSASGRGNRKGGRSRKASAAGLAPIASSSSTLAPIASAPPNATGFGSKASIDSLVQHMRDSVKDHSGKDDWAQDNDDSLPDLDDWDVDSKSNVSGSSNVLSVKPTPSSVKTAPIGFQGMAAQQKAAKDKLADSKKNRRGAKGKKEKSSEASPVSPLPPSPVVLAPVLPPPPAPRALNPTTVPTHPLAAIPPHRPPPQQVAVQLPPATIKRVADHSPTGQTPLLPSPVFATLNPPFSGNNPPPVRRSGQPGKGDWRSRDFSRSGALSASASKKDLRPHHLASNSAELGAIREEILTANTVTKPNAPIGESSHADSVVRLPSSPTGAALPELRGSEHGPSSSNPPSSGSSKAHNSSMPTTPKMNGGTVLPGSHRRTPSTQSQTNAPHSPRRSNQDARDVFTASHSRTHSATRPKISVNALFQLNRSLASNGPARPAPSQAVA